MFMISIRFQRSKYDSRIYQQGSSVENNIYLLLYVDDILIAGKELKDIGVLKNHLSKEFEMKDIGPARRILGIDITRNDSEKEIYLTQESYLKKVLQRYNMILSKKASVPLSPGIKLSAMQSPTSQKEMINMRIVPYASVVGSLMYSMV